ncbi:hypothetical protein BH10BAC2_BH10BAC2_44420 [soil metagenome]
MKNTFNKTLVATFVLVTLLVAPACKKNAEEPEQTCKTCIARDKLEGAPVANERVCTDEAEDSFRNTHSDQNVTCE